MIEYEAAHTIQENIMAKEETRTFQICAKVKDIMDSQSVDYRNLAYDSTGGGSPFGDVLSIVLKTRELIAVQFAERASERTGAGTDRRPAHERYANRAAEIWMQMKPFLRSNQVANLPDELMNEMSAREYSTGQRGRITLQPKTEMKAITGNSPDNSDSFFLGLEAAITRLHIASKERGALILPEDDYLQTLRDLDIVTIQNQGIHEWEPAA